MSSWAWAVEMVVALPPGLLEIAAPPRYTFPQLGDSPFLPLKFREVDYIAPYL